MIEARVDWDGLWRGPLSPELHNRAPASWSALVLEASPRDLRRAAWASHRLRARGWPAPRPLGLLQRSGRARLLLQSDARALPSPLRKPELASLGALLRVLTELKIHVPALAWPTLGLRAGSVVPLDLRGARRACTDPRSRHLAQLYRPDLSPRLALAGLRACAANRPQARLWARQWLEAALARGETRSAGL